MKINIIIIMLIIFVLPVHASTDTLIVNIEMGTVYNAQEQINYGAIVADNAIIANAYSEPAKAIQEYFRENNEEEIITESEMFEIYSESMDTVLQNNMENFRDAMSDAMAANQQSQIDNRSNIDAATAAINYMHSNLSNKMTSLNSDINQNSQNNIDAINSSAAAQTANDNAREEFLHSSDGGSINDGSFASTGARGDSMESGSSALSNDFRGQIEGMQLALAQTTPLEGVTIPLPIIGDIYCPLNADGQSFETEFNFIRSIFRIVCLLIVIFVSIRWFMQQVGEIF